MDGFQYKAIFTPDEAAKAEAVAKFMKEAVPTALGQLERRLKERGGQFFVGNALTWADLAFYGIYDAIGDKVTRNINPIVF